MSLQNLIAEYSRAREAFIKEATKAFKQEVKEFLKECSKVKVIKWRQYTPYFNDGEPCVFRVCDPVFSNAKDPNEVSYYGEYEGEEEGIWATEGTYGLPAEVTDIKSRLQEFSDLLCSNEMEPVLLDMFGDHVVVTVTKRDITVDEYEHD